MSGGVRSAGALLVVAAQLGQGVCAQPYHLQRVDTASDPSHITLRLVAPTPPPALGDSATVNVARHLAQLQGQIGLPVWCGGVEARTNLYGEFTCPRPPQNVSLSVSAGRPNRSRAGEKLQRWHVALPAWQAAGHIVVSDLDDTLIAWPHRSLWRDVMTQNALTRPVLGDAAAFLRAQAQAGAAVMYLSNSPRSLLPEVQGFLRRRGLPAGDAIFLRPMGMGGQAHKAQVLEALAQHSRARFTLLGDDVGADPQVYARFAARWPGRVQAVHIRAVRIGKFIPRLPRLPEP